MASEAQRRAVDRYDKQNTVQVHIKLNLSTDGDILKRLEEQESKQGYIKGLIRADIAFSCGK